MSDLNYLCSETDVSFCLFCKTSDVLIGGWKEGRFSATGKASYSGLISLTKTQQTEVFEKHKVRLAQSQILQTEKIRNYSVDYPFVVATPNAVIESWLSIPIEKVDWKTIPFLFYPEERQSAVKLVNGFLEHWAAKDEVVEGSIKACANPLLTVDKELFHNRRSFSLDDVCICSDELAKAKKYLQTVTVDEKQVPNKSSDFKSTIVRTDDFNDLLIEIIKSYPDLKAKEYWRVIEKEASEPEGLRSLDRYNLLDSISEDDAIKWRDRKGKPRNTISFGSFSNRISKMKKQVFN